MRCNGSAAWRCKVLRINLVAHTQLGVIINSLLRQGVRFRNRGHCFDNAMAESFFATLECELLARQSLPTKNAARLALFDYIKQFYNTHRRHWPTKGGGQRIPE